MAAARYKMISIPEALDTALQHTPVLGTETVSLQAALGRILAATVTAKDALPPFPASIKVCVEVEEHYIFSTILTCYQHIALALCQTAARSMLFRCWLSTQQ